MVSFSTDAEILKYEPMLFSDLHLPWQVLVSGSGGTLSGTIFTAEGADFVAAKVSAGGVIYLRSADGTLDGAYEIVSVDSATELSVSVLRPDAADEAIAPPGGSDISYRVSTFAPQAGEAGFRLTEYFGVRPGDANSAVETGDILDTEGLRRSSVFAVISSVYAILASKTDNENFWQKSLHYQRLFEKARERCRLGIDTDGDGVVDLTKSGASVKLTRD